MLLKNVVRTLREKWMQLIAIGIIIVLSSCTYTMMFYGLSGIDRPTADYLEQYNQEDFSVEMLNVLTEEEAGYPLVAGLIARNFYSLRDIKQAEPSTFRELMDNRIRAFEKAYPETEVELREYKNTEYPFQGKTHKAILLKDAKTINLS